MGRFLTKWWEYCQNCSNRHEMVGYGESGIRHMWCNTCRTVTELDTSSETTAILSITGINLTK